MCSEWLHGLEFAEASWIGFLLVAAFYLIGVLHILHALMHTRTSQGTIAWVVSLLSVPFIAIPLYWLLVLRHTKKDK